jgi:hypothetical protein
MYTAQDEGEEVDIGQLTMVPYTDVSSPSRPPRLSSGNHRRMSSISYPDLLEAKVAEKPVSPISRSKTLPRHIQLPKPTHVDNLPVDSVKLPRMRRWILALVIGKCVF